MIKFIFFFVEITKCLKLDSVQLGASQILFPKKENKHTYIDAMRQYETSKNTCKFTIFKFSFTNLIRI